ncbi:hypothetical protein D3C81_1365120 [compost metagenome]
MVRTAACAIPDDQVSQLRGRRTAWPCPATRCRRQQAGEGKAQPLPARPWQGGKAISCSGWTMARRPARTTGRLRRRVPGVALRLGLKHAEGAVPWEQAPHLGRDHPPADGGPLHGSTAGAGLAAGANPGAGSGPVARAKAHAGRERGRAHPARPHVPVLQSCGARQAAPSGLAGSAMPNTALAPHCEPNMRAWSWPTPTTSYAWWRLTRPGVAR